MSEKPSIMLHYPPVIMNEPLRKLTLAHSPDSDDAFMFWALSKGYIESPGLDFVHTLSDIQSLNQAALQRTYDITAISVHAYPYVARDYALLNVGASVGDNYGPIVVSKSDLKPSDLENMTVAIPGSLTTASLALRLALPGVRTEEYAFDQIVDAVKAGEVEAGVIIHEGQITYKDDGLYNVIDFGKWWKEETGLPLPLGANVIKKELGPELMNQAAKAIRDSIQYGFDHRAEGLGYAVDFGRNLGTDKVDEFVSMYVNDFTVDWGEEGRNAVRELLRRGTDAGIVPAIDEIEFVG